MNDFGSFVFYIIFNSVFVLIVSPFFMSLIKKVKALSQRRKGPPLFQTYRNLAKLMKKEVVYSSTSSLITRITPVINITVLLVAAVCVPLVFIPVSFGLFGNIILFLYLLALAKFFMALSGLDAGSTFGNMGSSREMTISAVFEPVIIIVFAALAFVFKTTDLYAMFASSATTSMPFFDPLKILLSISIFIILLVETSRIPVDNPETHLELTMIHEAMILENSGKNLAMMELAHAVKQTLIMAILINLIIPYGLVTETSATGMLIGAALFIIKGSVISIVVAVSESSIAKSRLFRLPKLFMLAMFFSFLTILFEVLLK
jgi:formate hydrogenlyase subunit 4